MGRLGDMGMVPAFLRERMSFDSKLYLMFTFFSFSVFGVFANVLDHVGRSVVDTTRGFH